MSKSRFTACTTVVLWLLGLHALTPAYAQIVLRTGSVVNSDEFAHRNPHGNASLTADPRVLLVYSEEGLSLNSQGAFLAPCQVGQVLSPGESCTVGTNTFQVLADGRGRYGGITTGQSITVGDFKASRISGTNNWRIDAVPGGSGGIRFTQAVASQSFPRGQSITPLVLPEATGGVSPVSYSLAPALPTDLSFDSSTRTISGTPTEVTTAPVTYTYTATDAAGDAASLQFSIEVHSAGAGMVVDIQYDQGEAVGAGGRDPLFYSLPGDERMSTRFVPKGSTGDNREVRIDRIWLAPYYDNQFRNTTVPTSAPRDLTVYIYADQGGSPGDVLFSKVINDPRAYAGVTDFNLDFFELDLSNESIGVLPDVVHIAYGNAGSDPNTLVTGPAPYATENVSHLYFNNAWAALWDVTVGGDSFNETVVPIRARFRLGGATAPLQFTQTVASQSFPRGQSITPLVLPEATGGVSPVSYSLAPALPTDLSFDSSTRTISGTPTEVTTAPVTYTYMATDAAGDAASLQFSIEVYSPVATESRTLPELFAVHGNYPNPFRQSTRIVFDLPSLTRVSLEVFDMVGRRVKTLLPKDISAGWERYIELDARSLPPGHYVYRLTMSSAGGNIMQSGHFVRIR